MERKQRQRKRAPSTLAAPPEARSQLGEQRGSAPPPGSLGPLAYFPGAASLGSYSTGRSCQWFLFLFPSVAHTASSTTKAGGKVFRVSPPERQASILPGGPLRDAENQACRGMVNPEVCPAHGTEDGSRRPEA